MLEIDQVPERAQVAALADDNASVERVDPISVRTVVLLARGLPDGQVPASARPKDN